ncbi:hypothetical protein R4K55_05725 [Brachyspira alvinipulli]|uniref:hypothetical protein n=1 Tax=Brachyspira alvinipulli TaxID=84379 RepID=UPI003005693F
MASQKINAEKEVLAIRISAEYSDLDKYIYMVFFIDKFYSKLIDMTFVISGDHKLLKFLNSYTDLLELYKHIEIYNKINTVGSSYLNKFKESINNILSEDRNINNIIVYHNNNNIISIIDMFSSSMNRFMDFHIGTFDIVHNVISIDDVNLAMENLHKELENMSNSQSAVNSENKNEASGNANSVPNYKLINASFIVDPISGKSINDIQPGDKVIVSINSNTVEENIIYLELNGKQDKYSKYLVPAEVLEKNVEEKSIKILLKLIEGYCCLIEESEPIKLKIFNPNKDVYTMPEKDDEKFSSNKNESFIKKLLPKMDTFKLAMLGLGAVIIIVFISIVYVFFFQG